MITISAPLDHPYAGNVESFFAQQFPGAHTTNDRATKLDVITTALVGSSQVRYGSIPKPEGLVAIRRVISSSITEGRAIPILVPFGSRKAKIGEKIDVAEVAAIKQLIALQERVQQHHAPGVDIYMRLEDTSGNYLFAADGQASVKDTKEYCGDFVKLVHTLGANHITPRLESELMDEESYYKSCSAFFPLMLKYLIESDNKRDEEDSWAHLDSYKLIKTLGWVGTVPYAQRTYYYYRYNAMNPDITPDERTKMLARYLTSSWARKQNYGVGYSKTWGSDYIAISFCPPVPGTPPGMFDRYLYYRTLPLKYAQSHMPPWRCKGYLRCNGTVTPKLASWKDQHPYISSMLSFSNEDAEVRVQADYVIEEEHE